MIDPDKYFIACQINGKMTGRGLLQFDAEEAQDFADMLNRQAEGRAVYFLLPGWAVIQEARGLAASELSECG